MYRKMLRSKIHRATVTDANLNYEGSITIDSELLKSAGMEEYELVQVANINNGERFETYVIKGKRGDGVVGLNGAAARLGNPGDLAIIMSVVWVKEDEAKKIKPQFVDVSSDNKVLKIKDNASHD